MVARQIRGDIELCQPGSHMGLNLYIPSNGHALELSLENCVVKYITAEYAKERYFVLSFFGIREEGVGG